MTNEPDTPYADELIRGWIAEVIGVNKEKNSAEFTAFEATLDTAGKGRSIEHAVQDESAKEKQ